MNILGTDPGIRSFGFTVMDVGTQEVIDAGTIRTENDSKATKTLDGIRRVREIGRELADIIAGYDIALICTEALSWGGGKERGGKKPTPGETSYEQRGGGPVTMVQMGMVWGMLVTIKDVPVVTRTPQQIKKAVRGAAGATKTQVAEALAVQFPTVLPFLPRARLQHEHVWDSLGAIVASRDTELYRAVMAMHNNQRR